MGMKLEGQARNAYVLGKLEDKSRPFDEEDRSNLFRGLWLMGRYGGYYFIPMYATYSMRMQSNPFVDNTDL